MDLRSSTNVISKKKHIFLSLVAFAFVLIICINSVFFKNQYMPKTDTQNFEIASPFRSFQNDLDSQNFEIASPFGSFQNDLLSGIPLKCPVGGSYSELEFVIKYERFLKDLEKYVSYHETMTKFPSRRTLVWWCSSYMYCGGLGDRIKGITYSLLLAMLSRRRLIIVWPTHSEGDFLHPHMINWKDEMVCDLLKRHASGMLHFTFMSVLGGKVDKTKATMGHYMKIIGSNETNVFLTTNLEPCSLLDQKRNGNNPNWLMDAMQLHGLMKLSGKELDDMVGIVFRYLFKMDDEVLERMSAAAELLGLNHSPYVAVHVRTGFANMSNDEKSINPKLMRHNSEWELALRCAINAADELSGKNMTSIFLATDSNQVKKIALKKYGTRIRTLKSVLIHMDKLKKNPHPLSAEEKEGLIVALVEFLLIAQGEILVRGESGFSIAAGLLCGMYDGSKTVRKVDKCS